MLEPSRYRSNLFFSNIGDDNLFLNDLINVIRCNVFLLQFFINGIFGISRQKRVFKFIDYQAWQTERVFLMKSDTLIRLVRKDS